MDYYSILDPLDPQVKNKEGKWVASFGNIDKFNDAIQNSLNGKL